MGQESFKAGFEAFVPHGLQRAYDFVGSDDRVETIWIVGFRDGDWASGRVAYRIDGVVASLKDAAEMLGVSDWLDVYQVTAGQVIMDLGDVLLTAGVRAENPTRLVIRYDVNAQAMNADFYYEPLKMGPDDTLGEVSQAWFERLQQTGNDSASD